MSIDPPRHFAAIALYLCLGWLAGCAGAGEQRVFREQAVPSELRVPGDAGLVFQVAAVPGGLRRCVLIALDASGAELARDAGSGPQGLPWLRAPQGTRSVRLELPLQLKQAHEPAAARRVQLYVNDPESDRDGDGLGAALEHALGTCDAPDDQACARALLAKYYQRVPHATRDTDRDGLSDSDELFGVKHEPRLDLPRFGADPRHKDVFVEVDHSTRVEPPGLLESDLVAIRELFARGSAAALRNPDRKPGVAVHFDVGFEPADPSLVNLFGTWGGSGESDGDYKLARREDFSKERARYFRYAVLARGGLGQSSGDALVINRDFNRVALLAHELAHTLGLKHEGHPSWGAYNCKPNHRSIINYAYQNEHAIGFSRTSAPLLNPTRVLERTRTAPAVAARLREPPFELDASEQGVDWNRDGVLQSEPVRAGLTWATYKSCVAASAGQAVLAERARAATPVVLGVRGVVHVLWIDEQGALMHRTAEPSEHCSGKRCATLSTATPIEGLSELAQISGVLLDDRSIALAHASSTGELSVSTLRRKSAGWSVATTQRVLGAETQEAPAIARLGEGGVMMLFRAADGGLAQARADAPTATFDLALAVDQDMNAIPTARGPSMLELGTGELCGVFPDRAAHIRFYCYERASNAWRDLTARAFYATLGPKTGGAVGMAYHRFRYADGSLVGATRGAVYLSYTEPAPGGKAPDNPILMVSRALDSDALARDTIDFRWRGSLINQWTHVAVGTAVALYEDASLPSLVAVMPARIARKEGAPKTSARLELLPVADGTFDATLGAGNDFEVMERGICTTLRGPKLCGGPDTAAY